MNNQLVCELADSLPIEMKIDKIEELITKQAQLIKYQDGLSIFYLISKDINEVNQIEKSIESKCIEHCLWNTFIMTMVQINNSSNEKVKNEKVIEYYRGEGTIKQSLADDLRRFLNKLVKGSTDYCWFCQRLFS